MKPFLSIIVPVYNIQDYIDVCLESIKNQIYEDFEVIIIDDGSEDMSGAICDRYVALDSRFKVIHKENEGLVSARKEGVKHAQGKYVGYVDGDDWIEPEMYQKMITQALQSDSDIVVCDVLYCTDEAKEKMKQTIEGGLFDEKRLENELWRKMLYNGQYFEHGFLPCVWNKIYKREILQEIQMKVDNRLTMGEDAACSYFCLLSAKKVFYMKESFLYNYRNRNTSMAHKDYYPQIDNLVLLLDFMKKNNQENFYEFFEEQLCYFAMYLYSCIILELTSVRRQIDAVTKRAVYDKILKSDIFMSIKERKLILPKLQKNMIAYVEEQKLTNMLKLYGSLVVYTVQRKLKEKNDRYKHNCSNI